MVACIVKPRGSTYSRSVHEQNYKRTIPSSTSGNSYPTSTSKRRRSIECLPSYPSRPRFEHRPTSRRQGSRCQTEGVKPGAPNAIIAQARFRSDRVLTPKFGGRPVGNWLKVAESVACTDPPPYAYLFLGLLFCQSYQSLSVVYKAHVSR